MVLIGRSFGSLDRRVETATYGAEIRERGVKFNSDTGVRIKAALGSYKPVEEGVIIACVGSDGRTEKGFESKLEITMYHNGVAPHIIEEIRRIVMCLKDDDFKQLINDQNIEIKDITRDTMNYGYGNTHLVSPGRVMDSFVLYGNPQLLRIAKERLVEEWIDLERGRRFVDYLCSRRKAARHIMIRGTEMVRGALVTHLDFDHGIAYYYNHVHGDSENAVGQTRSFKFGPLRFIQISVEKAVALAARSFVARGELDKAVGLVMGIPNSTAEKLQYLAGERVLNLAPADLADLIDCYLRFLQLYHISEFKFKQGHTELAFDVTEVRGRTDAINRLLTGSN